VSRVPDAPLGSEAIVGTGKPLSAIWEAFAASVADALQVGEWGRFRGAIVPGSTSYASVTQGAGIVQVFVDWGASGYAPGTLDLRTQASGVLHLANSSGSTVTHVLVVGGVATLPAGGYRYCSGSLTQILEV
jgi:hypothetical protein